MSTVHYHIVEHAGGWAYKVGDTFSETFASHDQARAAAERAAGEQEVSGEDEGLVYQDKAGKVREELSRGDNRPRTDVEG